MTNKKITMKSARVLLVKEDKILLIFRNNHGNVYFTIPGGNMENSDKSLEDTAKRELYEETSIISNITEHLTYKVDKKYKKEQHLYLGEYVSGLPKLTDNVEMKKMNDDHDDYFKPMWVNLEIIKDLIIMPEVLEKYVKDYISNKV